ncbi:hypothetical protein F0562_001118 [Nyssa sinensis]|uniref:Uncharacterized protein n=1 Tax=Nyssa sinensis TaxID=561372 RepID=A0A5J5C2I9_9ASTE|nr:hypothetical protein F0562_001118 [Nyssa sinensis]
MDTEISAFWILRVIPSNLASARYPLLITDGRLSSGSARTESLRKKKTVAARASVGTQKRCHDGDELSFWTSRAREQFLYANLTG